MSFLETVKSFFAGETPRSNAIHHATGEAGEALRALRGVVDPEMRIDIVRLGMVRDLVIDGNVARVTLTPTTPGCPLAAWIVGACQHALGEAGFEAEVRIVTEPPWSPADMEG